MNKILQSIFLLFVICSFAFAEEEINTFTFDSKEPLFISLGPECYVAGHLAQIGYRRASFPFDWLLTLDHSGVVELLDDNFKYFLDPSYYSLHTNGALINTYYHIEFRHEHDNDFIGKYGRRIDRFRRLNNYSGKVFFMRESYAGAESPSFYWPCKDVLNISSEHALELKRALKNRFPNLDFSLVIMNYCADRTTMKITDDIIMVNAYEKSDIVVFLSKLVDALLKYAEDPLPFGEEFFLDEH